MRYGGVVHLHLSHIIVLIVSIVVVLAAERYGVSAHEIVPVEELLVVAEVSLTVRYFVEFSYPGDVGYEDPARVRACHGVIVAIDTQVR